MLDSGRLVELFPEWSDERFPPYAAYPTRVHRAAKVRVFVEFCLEILAGALGTSRVRSRHRRIAEPMPHAFRRALWISIA